jgi:hypothetical protein
MLRLFFDHDFNHRILRGLIQRIPDLDYLTPTILGNIEESDENHLQWACENHRVIVTHDVNTMTDAANQRFENGESISGLIIVPQRFPIGEAINDLEMIIICDTESEFENRIRYLPID